jgi:transcriptional regulator with XRE-family HTH domain
MSVETLVDQFPEAVGRRVRKARADREWTLDQLAAHSGVSRRMIVNVEAGSCNASIATLLRLAAALQVTLADLVAEASRDDAVAVTKAIAREPLWRGEAGGFAVLITSADTPDMLELWEWSLEPGEVYSSEAHRRGTRELLHLISGRLRLTVDGRPHVLLPGDGVSFAADVAHEYANDGQRRARFTMTVLEPVSRMRP